MNFDVRLLIPTFDPHVPLIKSFPYKPHNKMQGSKPHSITTLL